MDDRFWQLDPSVTFLNHGSFGSCPRPVLEAQSKFRAQLERQPVKFFVRDLEPLIDASRDALARFVGADAASIAFVTNATAAVNAVLRSLEFAPGDEILTTDHGYNACRNVLEFVASKSGAKVVVAKVPFPIASPDEVLAALEAKVTARTKLALVDHVTSPTGLVFPIERIVSSLQGRGVDVLVDGAHGPGMLPLELAKLGAAYYTGNLHKWVCAPKGVAFLSARADRRELVRPPVISHGANATRTDRSRYHLEFDYMGTDDPSAILSVPTALATLAALANGDVEALMRENRSKVLLARSILCDALHVAPPAPESMIGSLASVMLPDATTSAPCDGIDPLAKTLWDASIEVPLFPWPAWPKRLLRVSAQRYNTRADYEKLASVLVAALVTGNR